LAFDAVAGKRYSIFAIELKPGQDPTTVAIHGLSFGEEMRRMPLYVIRVPLACILSPYFFLKVGKAVVLPPSARPFEDCCFLWIEDMETGEVVGGMRPPSTSR
jgi:hypothetical protein